jgi:DNA ligase-associated metallophosphoesterase
MSTQTLAWSLAGEPVVLDADRALAWPREATVFVADVHLGKDQVFREAGLALPSGAVAADLARLSGLVERHRARRLVVLGDLMHARTRMAAAWIREFGEWRAAHAALAVSVLRGNHDRALPQWPGVDGIDDGACLGPFVLRHEPAPDHRGHVLAGHLHPGVVLRERHGPPVRLPAFWSGPHRTVLPAFGRLTGLATQVADAVDRLIACAGASLVEVRNPQRRARASQSRAIRANDGSVAGSSASCRTSRHASANDSDETA